MVKKKRQFWYNDIIDILLYMFENAYLPNNVETIWMNDSKVKWG